MTHANSGLHEFAVGRAVDHTTYDPRVAETCDSRVISTSETRQGADVRAVGCRARKLGILQSGVRLTIRLMTPESQKLATPGSFQPPRHDKGQMCVQSAVMHANSGLHEFAVGRAVDHTTYDPRVAETCDSRVISTSETGQLCVQFAATRANAGLQEILAITMLERPLVSTSTMAIYHLRATVQRHEIQRPSEVVQAGAATCETGFGAVKRTNTRPYEPTASNINSTLERSYDDGCSLMQHNEQFCGYACGLPTSRLTKTCLYP